MTIAVNLRLLNGNASGLQELLKYLTRDHPEHLFVFLCPGNVWQNIQWPANVRVEPTGPAATHPFFWRYWFDHTVPGLLKKLGADVFISPGGVCPRRLDFPQIILLQDQEYFHQPPFDKGSRLSFFKRRAPQCLKKAWGVVTSSRFLKNEIVTNIQISEDKVRVIHNGIREGFRPMDFDEKTAVKKKLSGGMEYFLFAGAIQPKMNLLNLLKAFSIFKKRQQSGMKLLLSGKIDRQSESFLDDLKTYKFREDVIVTGYLEDSDFFSVMGAAYAFVYPVISGSGMQVQEAMHSGVPVLTSAGTFLDEISSGASLVADPSDPAAIAGQMMRLYKDEDLRKKMIAKGLEISATHSWKKASGELWDLIMNAVPSVRG